MAGSHPPHRLPEHEVILRFVSREHPRKPPAGTR